MSLITILETLLIGPLKLVFEIIFHALPAPKRLPQKYLIVRITTNPIIFTGIAKYIGRTMPVKKHTVDVAYIGKTLFTANNINSCVRTGMSYMKTLS